MNGYGLFADPGGWEHMSGWGMGWVFLALVVLLVAWTIWLGIRKAPGPDSGRRSALDTLNHRYASGEIDKDEYFERKNTLEQ